MWSGSGSTSWRWACYQRREPRGINDDPSRRRRSRDLPPRLKHHPLGRALRQRVVKGRDPQQDEIGDAPFLDRAAPIADGGDELRLIVEMRRDCRNPRSLQHVTVTERKEQSRMLSVPSRTVTPPASSSR